ncbi:UPF0739 protein C1orf74 homolog [Pyxicephalus adspersus]|uniref:Uncharacterized protein n=1 Tax=Pyxicephalus adspersus TaxID=30357 RepID=A0AAV3B7M4_PYXAD|nr:TPA: hypothetical protein GDO54_001588 [Pyxicephalus adspersus]DBA33977.1 TPA: hypothetical protein GDO54_001588 [Pyxicephalus adspersus]
MSLIKDLHLAAKHHLKERKRSLALKLAAEILFVDCGLKTSFLYDLNGASVVQIQEYLKELHQMGFIKRPLHVLSIADNILIINVSRTLSYLRLLLDTEDLYVIDVSAQLKQPEMFNQDRLCEIKSQLLDLLTLLRPYQYIKPEKISVADIPSPGWNLCTMFGFLLHFPAVYWFDTSKNFDNCLSFTPLKHFTVQTVCPKIGLQKIPVYSFSIPESVYDSVQALLQTWINGLRQMIHVHSSDFKDLEIITETVTLPTVAL